jgi:phage tail sheath protein FI
MPEYLTPGVYIEEIERGPRPIEGVPTSTAAFIGQTERGPIEPQAVTSYKEYQRMFGGVFGTDAFAFMPYAVSGFFENGGKRLFVCRLVGATAKSSELDVGNGFSIRASGAGTWGKRVLAAIQDSSTKNKDTKPVGFRIRLAYYTSEPLPTFDPFDSANARKTPLPSLVEDFDDLVVDENSPDYYGKRVPFIDMAKPDKVQGPRSSALGVLVRQASVAPNTEPGRKAGTSLGTVGTDVALIADDFDGLLTPDRREYQGLSALDLDPYREVALVYAPGMTIRDNQAIVQLIVDRSEENRFRFAVLDCEKGRSDYDKIEPRNTFDSSYAAFYYPWISVADPTTGAPKFIPPGGHVLGVYARTDVERGVFKAPANEVVRGALSLEYDVSDGAQGTLNPRGVNAIRSFPGRGIRIWGARTLTSNALWKYVSVRRLFIFLERSIYEGTQWVVFEPNDPKLWARVTDTIRIFLRGQWRLGALFGRTEEQAFFVTCDERVMTQDDILNGRLVCEIGIAPVRPAEFVIFRIFQNTAEAQR